MSLIGSNGYQQKPLLCHYRADDISRATQVGMTILGHRNESTYQRYDQSIALQKIAAMSIVAETYRDG